MSKCSVTCVVVVLGACSVAAQQAQTAVPDAPSHVAKASTAPTQAPPLGLDGKAHYFAERLFSPWNIVTPVFGSAYGMANPDSKLPREWRQGAGAFGRLYGAGIASLATFDTARFLSGLAFREDPRYFRAETASTGGRLKHALLFTIVDRSDSGRRMPAISSFVASAAAGTVGNLYIPPPYNGKSDAASRSAVLLAYFAGGNVRREFSPEFDRLRKKLHLP